MATKASAYPQVDFAEMAKEALEDCDGVWIDAVKRMVRQALNDDQFMCRNIEEMVWCWAKKHVSAATRVNKLLADDGHSRRVVPISTHSAFVSAVGANFARLMERPIWGGKPIGDCTALEIRTSVDRCSSNIAEMTRQMRWQQRVADACEQNGISGSDVVRECLSEGTLSKLWEASCA